MPKVVIKLDSKKEALTAKAKQADEQASGRQSSIGSAVFINATGETVLGSMQNQTATTSASGSKQEKLASALTVVKGTKKASEVREQGEVSEDSDTDQAQPKRPVKRMRGFRLGHTRRTSQAVALSFASFHKRQKRRLSKGMGASPELGAEAGAQSGEEAAMPLECKAVGSSERQTRRRQRKSLFGHRRKPAVTIKQPKLGRSRTRRVYYTYVQEPIPTITQDENKQQLRGQNITASEGEPSLFSEHIQQSSKNSSTTMSARSSRVIKAPKRFLDEEMIAFPKGSLSTWLKSQQREDGKPSTSLHESGYDDNSLQTENDSLSVFNSPSSVTEFPSKPGPGTSHIELYKNLKKLTLKLAEKKKGQPDSQGEYTHHGDSLTSNVRKRRRSKLMMEEMDSPGVVRKLAVVVNSEVGAPTHKPFEDIGNNSKNHF